MRTQEGYNKEGITGADDLPPIVSSDTSSFCLRENVGLRKVSESPAETKQEAELGLEAR